MSTFTATLTVLAESGNMGKIVLPGCDTIAKAQAFFTSVGSAYLEGELVNVSVTESLKVTPAGAIEGGNTDRKAIIRYTDATDQSTKRISLPSWGSDEGDILLTPEGERVPLVACQSVVEALQTETGHDLTALDGYIIQKR